MRLFHDGAGDQARTQSGAEGRGLSRLDRMARQRIEQWLTALVDEGAIPVGEIEAGAVPRDGGPRNRDRTRLPSETVRVDTENESLWISASHPQKGHTTPGCRVDYARAERAKNGKVDNASPGFINSKDPARQEALSVEQGTSPEGRPGPPSTTRSALIGLYAQKPPHHQPLLCTSR